MLVSCPVLECASGLTVEQWRTLYVRLRARLVALCEEPVADESGCVVPDVTDQAQGQGEERIGAWLARCRRTDAERWVVEQALARMVQGTYGVCEETGEPIGMARLMACPTATTTLETQVRREHRSRHFVVPS